MNPQMPTPQSPEQQPQGTGAEQLAALVPEAAPQPVPVPAPAPVAPVNVVLPAAPPPAVPPAPVSDPATPIQAPAVAADVDVIEKEWVDQAEAVIRQTAGDPYAEEEAVEALQIDYLQKRYGRTVRKPE